MSNVVSIDKFKTERNVGSVVQWFEQFQTGPLFMEIIRGAFEHHSDHEGEYVLPFTIRAVRNVPGHALDLTFSREPDEFTSLTLGWMSAPTFATYGMIRAMPSTLVETTEQSKAYLKATSVAILEKLNVYNGFGGVGFSIAMGICLLVEIVRKTGEVREFVTPEGDHYFTAFINEGNGDTGSDPEVITLLITHQAYEYARTALRRLMRSEMPKAGPIWENVKGGKIRAQIVSWKEPESPLFKKGKNKDDNKWIDMVLNEEIVGDDRPAMEKYIRNLLGWHEHYATHFNLHGWNYDVIWKK